MHSIVTFYISKKDVCHSHKIHIPHFRFGIYFFSIPFSLSTECAKSWECRHIKVIMGENWKLFVWHERPLIATFISLWKISGTFPPHTHPAANAHIHTSRTHLVYNSKAPDILEFKILFGALPCAVLKKFPNCLHRKSPFSLRRGAQKYPTECTERCIFRF